MPGTQLLILHVPDGTEAQRLDQAIVRRLQSDGYSFSRTELKRWFDDGRVRLEGRPARASQLLAPGSHEVTLADWDHAPGRERPRAHPEPRGCFLPVLHEDESLLILDKSSGTPSAPQREDELSTAVSAALARFPGLPAPEGTNALEPGLLHRLDTGTSGALAFAKTERELERLKAAWKDRAVRKIYRAVVAARGAPGETIPFPKSLPLTLDWELGHDARSSKKMIALQIPARDRARIRGKPIAAVTRILESRELPGGVRDLTIELETGVMHQIRCHLAALRWPIAGDTIYRGMPAPRLWLHAWKLELPREDGSRLLIEAPLPAEWPR